MKDAWNFCQAEDYWNLYRPLTPWGKDSREARTVHVDRDTILSLFDDIDAAARLLEGMKDEPLSPERLAYHLKRMPRIPMTERTGYELLELFQMKKFLANYRGLLPLLPADAASRFSLSPVCREFAAELDRGGSDAETFYVADSYHPALPALRARIRELDEALRSARDTAESRAKADHGLVFDGREFLVVPRELVSPLLQLPASFSVEPYDDGHYLVRLMPQAAALALIEEREKMFLRERELEQEVLAALSVMACGCMPELRSAVSSVTRLDIARAGAVLAAETGATRPHLDSAELVLDRATLYPCALECQQLGLDYLPLSARFGKKAIVLFGSNMGGKTVVLKTVLFMQLMAQAGLFVPAREFSSRVYGNVEYIGELAGERLAGLSGFGFEVWRFQEAWDRRGDSLVAFDELARTTGSHEAEALLSSVIEGYSECPGTRAFFATHFRGVARIGGAEYWRMRGLDHGAASECLDADAPLPQRLSGINRHMRYELEPDDPDSSAKSDALAIAAMLGLEPALVKRAAEFFKGR